MRALLSRLRLAPPLLMAAALANTGCKGDEEAKSGTKLEVECIGMSMRHPLGGYFVLESDYGGRCQLLVSDTVYDPQNVQLLEQSGANWGNANTAALVINFAKKTWVSRGGSVSFSQWEPDRATGTYDLIGVESSTGEEVKLSGPISFCDYVANANCPYQTSGLDALDKRLSFKGPDGFAANATNSRANECRVLIDKKTSAVRVDVQLAILNGVNIARFRDRCGPVVPPFAGFVFVAPNVSGPGSYGPLTSKPIAQIGEGPAYLPDFHLTAPTVYWLGNCADSPERLMDVHPIAGTSCTFSIADNPGKFELACTGAEHSETGNFYVKQGTFELSSDCDVRYVE